MKYDLFSDDEIVAGILEHKLDMPSLVDTTEKPLIYQLFGLDFRDMVSVRDVVGRYSDSIEIRRYPDGDYVFRNGAWQGSFFVRVLRKFGMCLCNLINTRITTMI